MGLISSSILLNIADRAAKQYEYFATPFSSINATGGGFYWQLITAADDPDLEIPTLNSYYTVDNDTFDVSTALSNGLGNMKKIVTAMDSHFSRVGHTGGWDSYLNAADERVSDYFNQLYYITKNQYLLANNVFSEDENVFGTWEYGDTFTDGVSYGNGSWTNRASGSYFAPTQLTAVVSDTSTSCSSLVLQLTVKDETNSVTTINTSAITGGAGTESDIGASSDRFLDVTNITAVSGDASGNKVYIKNKIERTIAL